MAVINNPFLNEILEERLYPLLEHIKEFFGFGNEDEATLSRLELTESQGNGKNNHEAVHRTSSDTKVLQQTRQQLLQQQQSQSQQQQDIAYTNSCCHKITGRCRNAKVDSQLQQPATPNHHQVQPEHTSGGGGGGGGGHHSDHGNTSRSGWLSRSPLRAFTSAPTDVSPSADSSPAKMAGLTSSSPASAASNRESNGRPPTDCTVLSQNPLGTGSGCGIVSSYDCNPMLMFPTEEQLQSVEEPDYSVGEKLGRLQYSVSYDMLTQTLTVKVVRAEELAAKDLSGTSDPYVKVMLLPDKKQSMTTNIKRRNLNPRWNEVFAFEGFPQQKLFSRTLYLLVLVYDRFSRDDPIGEVCVPLRQIDLLSGQTTWSNLQPCKGAVGRLGALLLSLCYQPAIGCITLVVIKAKDLKAKDINGLSDPYVKVWLMYDGKRVEKKKTEVKEKTLNPTFNDSFLFSVPYDRVRQTSLVVSVMDFDRLGRNEAIGQVLLGSKSGPMEVKHWNEMFAKTRQPVLQWHILKDFG